MLFGVKLLRELNVIKNNVRISFNNDSSVEVSRENISGSEKIEDKQLRRRISGSISTPKFIHKAYGPFDCTLSPISAWRLTNANPKDQWNSTCQLKSTILDRVTESIDDNTPSSTKSLSAKSNSIPIVDINEGNKTNTVPAILIEDKTPSSTKSLSRRTNSIPIVEINEDNKTDTIASILIKDNTPLSTKSLSTKINSIPKIDLNEGNETDTFASILIENTCVSKVEDLRNLSVVLPPGKWRRSLTVWKRLNQPKYECLESSLTNNTDRFTLNIRNSRKTCSLNRRTASVISPRRKSELELLKICKQTTVLSFSSLYSNTGLRNCRKIGEGTYGEVFVNSEKNNEQTVIKIIPIEGEININGEPQKTFETILPEVLITSELSKLRQTKTFSSSGFVFLKNVRYFRGKYPDYLIELWDLFEQNYGSENDHPEVFKDDQLYISLEIAFGGKDLEGYVFKNSEQAYSAFLQVAFSLAVAEKVLEFEHRDLHVGNILIQTTNEKTVECTLDKKTIRIPTNGVKATIIDYTLSRILLNKCSFYNDLSADEELFCAKGDYQYDIYRLMKERLNNNWQIYEPYTNVLWLHYLLIKLVDCGKYKNFRSKQHKLHIERLKLMRDSILSCSSAYDFSTNLQI
ncbi:serine/threonine-protein kinase haspin homolog isoform X2 [Episyrphus balteatus]|uniref:serine/threonine-protein kinase haspin homolog isoform X2 n=1 Tax=Episyrphus balteatus TaxID=286459 RepID=UPI0024854201|nr:serine/threonine-protein kinase haspin homolog isoform X2 [Episyrphus balteatus]